MFYTPDAFTIMVANSTTNITRLLGGRYQTEEEAQGAMTVFQAWSTDSKESFQILYPRSVIELGDDGEFRVD